MSSEIASEETPDTFLDDALSLAPDLSSYHDYRDYLRERLAFEKARNPRLSLHFFARKMKVSTPFLSMLFSKKKHMSLLSLVAVSDYLRMERKDRMLMVFNLLETTSKSDEQRNFFSLMCGQLRAFKMIDQELPKRDLSEYHAIYGSEVGMILSALAQTSDFRDDLDWVMSRITVPSVSRDEVARLLPKVIETHKALGLHADESTVQSTIVSSPASEPLYRPAWNLHGQALEYGDKVRPAAFGSLTITVNEEGYRDLIKAFGEFCTKIEKIAESNKFTDRVFVLNTGLFCVAKPPIHSDAAKSNEAPLPDSVVSKL
jgi:uncharacterized protein (TIGR02147 family)